jgi:WD40 repeat protein
MGATSSPDLRQDDSNVGCGDWIGKPSASLSRGTRIRMWVSSIAYSPDGRHIISGSQTRRFECGMRRLDHQSASLSRGTRQRVWSVAYSPDGRHIISGSETRRFECGMRRLDWQSASLSRGTRLGVVRCLLSRWAPHHLRIWRQDDSNVGCGDWMAVGKPLEGHTDWVSSVAYSPDGRHIISGSDDKTIRMWDAETGLAVGKPLEGHTDWVLVRCLLSRWAPHHLRI